MSKQRVCDLDGTVIAARRDTFYTITEGRTGHAKDVCEQCARSNLGVALWTATTVEQVGKRVRRTAGAMGKYVWECVQTGTTGEVEPTWPTGNSAPGTLVEDGTARWVTVLAPNDNTTMTIKLPGTTAVKTSLYGLMSETNEPA